MVCLVSTAGLEVHYGSEQGLDMDVLRSEADERKLIGIVSISADHEFKSIQINSTTTQALRA